MESDSIIGYALLFEEIMETGLVHGHKGLAYLMFVLALVNVVMTLMPNRNTPTMAKIINVVHSIVVNLGRLMLIVGMSIWIFKWSQVTVLNMWWAWSALLLWGPIEVVSKRLVKPEVTYMMDGGQSTNKLTIGVIIELLVIAVIFGLMSAQGLRA